MCRYRERAGTEKGRGCTGGVGVGVWGVGEVGEGGGEDVTNRVN